MSEKIEGVRVRRANASDAPGISKIWEVIIGEGKFSAVARPWSPDEQAGYLDGLSDREGTFVADAHGQIIAFQTLDR
jgi:hypothetical protein